MIKKLCDHILDRIPFIACSEATRLLSKRLDTKLTLKETIDLYLHLWVCEICQQCAKQFKGLSKLLKTYSPKGESKMSAEAKEKLKKIL